MSERAEGIEKIAETAKVFVGNTACKIMQRMASVSGGRIYSLRVFYFFHKLTYQKGDWMDETQ
jgi:hypothetical protein